MSRNRFITDIFSWCILCERDIFSSSSFRLSSLNSFRNSIISEADDFDDLRFFFFGGVLRGSSSSSSSEWSAVPDSMAIDETVVAGTIFGLDPKNSVISAWNSHSFLSFPVRLLCSVTFLYFSSSFFHLFEHCSPVTFTEEVVLNWSAIRFQATFFLTFPLENKLSFCLRKEIRSFVLLDDHATNFVSSSSSPVIINMLAF